MWSAAYLCLYSEVRACLPQWWNVLQWSLLSLKVCRNHQPIRQQHSIMWVVCDIDPFSSVLLSDYGSSQSVCCGLDDYSNFGWLNLKRGRYKEYDGRGITVSVWPFLQWSRAPAVHQESHVCNPVAVLLKLTICLHHVAEEANGHTTTLPCFHVSVHASGRTQVSYNRVWCIMVGWNGLQKVVLDKEILPVSIVYRTS